MSKEKQKPEVSISDKLHDLKVDKYSKVSKEEKIPVEENVNKTPEEEVPSMDPEKEKSIIDKLTNETEEFINENPEYNTDKLIENALVKENEDQKSSEESKEDNKDEPSIFKKTSNIFKKDIEDKQEVSDFQGKVIQKDIKTRIKISDLKVDLNNIKIKEVQNPMHLHKNLETLSNNTPVFQIVAIHSGYVAYMSGITIPDMVAISSSNVDIHTHKLTILKIIHSHIEHTSLGKISFQEWLSITAIEDYSTFLYGIYCATYPDDNEFKITCGSCRKDTPVVVNNASLISTFDMKLSVDRVKKIIDNSNNLADLAKLSLINETTRIQLNVSKSIIDIKSPSLSEQLDLYKKLNTDILNDPAYRASTTFFLYVKNLYTLDILELQEGNIVFNPINEIERKLEIIHGLCREDGAQLSKAIQNEITKYTVDYVIKSLKCTRCNADIPKIPVNIETILFTQIGKDMNE